MRMRSTNSWDYTSRLVQDTQNSCQTLQDSNCVVVCHVYCSRGGQSKQNKERRMKKRKTNRGTGRRRRAARASRCECARRRRVGSRGCVGGWRGTARGSSCARWWPPSRRAPATTAGSGASRGPRGARRAAPRAQSPGTCGEGSVCATRAPTSREHWALRRCQSHLSTKMPESDSES